MWTKHLWLCLFLAFVPSIVFLLAAAIATVRELWPRVPVVPEIRAGT
jgi:hypothetical protein